MKRERVYAIRRTDGEMVDDEYAFLIRGGPGDWPDDEHMDAMTAYEGAPVEFELVEMKLRVLARRTFHGDICPNHTDEAGPHHSTECCYYDDQVDAT